MTDRHSVKHSPLRIRPSLDPVPAERTVLPDSIGLHIRLVQLGMLRQFQRLFGGTGLTISMHTMLMVIRDNPGIHQNALAEVLLLSQPNVAAAVSTLDQAGLVARAVDHQDRRALCLRLTARGRQVLDEAHEHFDALEKRMLGAFSDQDLSAFRGYLRRILDSIP